MMPMAPKERGLQSVYEFCATGTQSYLKHNQQRFKDILGVDRIGILKIGASLLQKDLPG